MRIVVWNCSQGFHRKFPELLELRPDIAVVPECAHPEVIARKARSFECSDWDWVGRNQQKGLAVFSFGDFKLSRAALWKDRHHLFLPLEVVGATQFNLLAVWAFNHRAPSPKGQRPPTTRDAVDYYARFLRVDRAIVAGDFNGNVIWDADGKYARFAPVNELLNSLGLESAYHSAFQEPLGQESAATLFWQHNPKKGYHIDYCYVSKRALGPDTSVVVGDAKKWLKWSDHAPVVLTIPHW